MVRDFAALYGRVLVCTRPAQAEEALKTAKYTAPTAAERSSSVLTADYGRAEYLTEDVLLALWDEMEQAFAASLAAAKVGLQAS